MRIDDNKGVSASSKHLVFAYYVTGTASVTPPASSRLSVT
uniref:Uncharacterized protein n=1 Tax=Brassica oleracea TaxID=3712 RepID=A0A3P6BUZ4_BRAOL|nr:unnamed protein product [Brassica oleracea]